MQRQFRSRTFAAALALAVPAVLLGAPAAHADPISQTSGFYVNPSSSPASWVAANPGDGRAAAIRSQIAQKPMASWFGNWSGDIAGAVGRYVAAADAVDKLPLLVAYNIPGRDACGGQAWGGCFCNAECVDNGDCCDDYAESCVDSDD
jgi:endoglucanase